MINWLFLAHFSENLLHNQYQKLGFSYHAASGHRNYLRSIIRIFDQGSEQALMVPLTEMDTQCVSNRKVKEMSQQMCGVVVSAT